MTALYLVLPLALLVATAAVMGFVWTVRSGQLDDVDTPPRRILFDDEAGPSFATSDCDTRKGGMCHGKYREEGRRTERTRAPAR